MKQACEEYYEYQEKHPNTTKMIKKIELIGRIKRTYEYDWIGTNEDRQFLLKRIMQYFTGNHGQLLLPPVWLDDKKRIRIEDQNELQKRSIEDIGNNLVLNYHGFSKLLLFIL